MNSFYPDLLWLLAVISTVTITHLTSFWFLKIFSPLQSSAILHPDHFLIMILYLWCQTRLPSGLLFVISIDVLANAIRNKNMIKGIKVGEKEIKTS